jgi:hypothetical protein
LIYTKRTNHAALRTHTQLVEPHHCTALAVTMTVNLTINVGNGTGGLPVGFNNPRTTQEGGFRTAGGQKIVVKNKTDKMIDLDVWAYTPFWARIKYWLNLAGGDTATIDGLGSFYFTLFVYYPCGGPSQCEASTGVPAYFQVCDKNLEWMY